MKLLFCCPSLYNCGSRLALSCAESFPGLEPD